MEESGGTMLSPKFRAKHAPTPKEFDEIKEGIEDFSLEVQEAGQLLRHCRETMGWSLSELGDQVNVNPDLIQMMEDGEQPIPLVEARMFGRLFNIDYHLFL
jgi:ribosome-binding protein aMBF1 (putative translation factor)